MYAAHKHVDPRPVGTRKWMMLTPTYLPPTSQKNVHDQIILALNCYYTTSHYPLQVETHSFEGTVPLWSPLPGKTTKLFFSTLPKTLSLRCEGTEAGVNFITSLK